MTHRLFITGAVLMLLGCPAAGVLAAGVPQGRQYQQALAAARNNDLATAAVLLQQLLNTSPADQRYRYDLIAVESWRGQPAHAAELATGLDPKTLPLYVLRAWARAEEDLQHYEQAAELYRQVEQRNTPDAAAEIALARLDLAQGHTSQAANRLGALDPAKLAADELRAWQESMIRTRLAQQRYIEVLELSNALLKSDPHNPLALDAQFTATLHQGMPFRAAAQTQGRKDKRHAADAAAIAREIHWGRSEVANSSPAAPERWSTTERAIQDAERRIAALQAQPDPAASVQLRQQQYDLLVALVDRRRMAEAVKLYQTLATQDPELPDWVKVKVASAYLALHQPAKAIPLFEQGLASAREDFDTQADYVHALLEAEHPTEAQAAADRLADTTPEWRNNAWPPLRSENADYPRAQQLAAEVRAYTEQLSEAQRRLENLTYRAPGNEDLATALAETRRLRGWPRQAAASVHRLLQNNPRYAWATTTLFNAQLDMQDYPAAEQSLAKAQRELPEETATRQSEQAWQNHRKAELVSSLSVGRSGGGTAGLPGSSDRLREIEFDNRLYSAPFAYHWRAFALESWEQARSGAVDLLRRSAGAGLDYRAPSWDHQLALYSLDRRSGAALESRYHPDDFWNFSLALSHNDRNLPLLASTTGVRSDSAGASLSYRWSEAADAGLSYTHSRFSDANLRDSAAAWWRQQLVGQARYQLDLRLDLANERNKAPADADIAYFNPSRLNSGSVSLINRWTQWRSYERQLSHQFTVTAGQSHQAGFGSAATGALDYELSYRSGPSFEWRFGLAYTRAPYDGVKENSVSARTSLDWRF